jgi:ketosteroid isomerase-like protein
VEFVRRAYETWWESGDLDALLEGFVDPEVVWIAAPHSPEPGPHRGHDGVRRAVAAYLDSFEFFRPRAERFLATKRSDELLVLATTHTRGKGSGVEVSIPVAHLVRVEGERITRFQVLVDRDDAIARFT